MSYTVVNDIFVADTPEKRGKVEQWFRFTRPQDPTSFAPAPKPLPGFERYSHLGQYKRPNRHLAEVRKVKKTIDVVNDALPLGCTLHPTKGFRGRSDNAPRIDMATAEAKRDLSAWYRLWHPKFKVAA